MEVCADDRATFVQEPTCSGAKPICDALVAQCVGCERCKAATQVCNNYQCECKRSHTGADCSQPRFQLVGSTVDYGFGVGVSGDGAVIVGTTYDVNEAYAGFAWTFTAKAANIDGTVIVGSSDQGAWVWDSELGLKMVKAIVADLGFATDDYDFRTLNAVSSDGRTIVGGTSTPSGIDRTFVVRLP